MKPCKIRRELVKQTSDQELKLRNYQPYQEEFNPYKENTTNHVQFEKIYKSGVNINRSFNWLTYFYKLLK